MVQKMPAVGGQVQGIPCTYKCEGKLLMQKRSSITASWDSTYQTTAGNSGNLKRKIAAKLLTSKRIGKQKKSAQFCTT
jgi:hypothetical protein